MALQKQNLYINKNSWSEQRKFRRIAKTDKNMNETVTSSFRNESHWLTYTALTISRRDKFVESLHNHVMIIIWRVTVNIIITSVTRVNQIFVEVTRYEFAKRKEMTYILPNKNFSAATTTQVKIYVYDQKQFL